MAEETQQPSTVTVTTSAASTLTEATLGTTPESSKATVTTKIEETASTETADATVKSSTVTVTTSDHSSLTEETTSTNQHQSEPQTTTRTEDSSTEKTAEATVQPSVVTVTRQPQSSIAETTTVDASPSAPATVTVTRSIEDSTTLVTTTRDTSQASTATETATKSVPPTETNTTTTYLSLSDSSRIGPFCQARNGSILLGALDFYSNNNCTEELPNPLNETGQCIYIPEDMRKRGKGNEFRFTWNENHLPNTAPFWMKYRPIFGEDEKRTPFDRVTIGLTRGRQSKNYPGQLLSMTGTGGRCVKSSEDAKDLNVAAWPHGYEMPGCLEEPNVVKPGRKRGVLEEPKGDDLNDKERPGYCFHFDGRTHYEPKKDQWMPPHNQENLDFNYPDDGSGGPPNYDMFRELYKMGVINDLTVVDLFSKRCEQPFIRNKCGKQDRDKLPKHVIKKLKESTFCRKFTPHENIPKEPIASPMRRLSAIHDCVNSNGVCQLEESRTDGWSWSKTEGRSVSTTWNFWNIFGLDKSKEITESKTERRTVSIERTNAFNIEDGQKGFQAAHFPAMEVVGNFSECFVFRSGKWPGKKIALRGWVQIEPFEGSKLEINGDAATQSVVLTGEDMYGPDDE